ncbi:MAG: PAS domain S-box protein [Nitrospirae bacterium]|nr:PAS domain S-box protein [Nitrospirota bacterium]MBF0536573.1 PAS domain S-box protein [Nitrospirota bacterium]MBF0615826.1 PAS domain S-box protein [Nitrospirota bacterium]
MMNYKLLDILNIGELQELTESFTRLTGAVIAVLDLEGDILAVSPMQTLCSKFHRVNPVTAARCRESDTVLASKLNAGQRYNVYKCRNGLVDAAVPIVIDGMHLGNLFTGQFFLEPPDKDYFIKQAEVSGFDKEEYLEALSKIPIFTEEHIKVLMEFLLRLASLTGVTGLSKKRALEMSENKMRLQSEILSNIDEGVIIIKASDGKIAYTNPKFNSIFGYKGDELIDKHVSILNAPVDVSPDDKAKQIMSELNETGLWQGEILNVKKDGTLFWSNANVSTFEHKECGTVWISIHRDITKRKALEEAVLKEKMFSETIINTLPGLFYLIDRTGKFLLWNKNLEIVSGYSHEEISNMTPFDFFTVADRDRLNIAIETVFKSGEAVIDVNFHTKDGQDIPYYFTGKRIEVDGNDCLTGVGTDISELKTMEIALHDSEEKYRLLFTNENDAIYLCDAETLEFIDSNNAWCNLYGYTKDEMKGKSTIILSAEPDKTIETMSIAEITGSAKVRHRFHKNKNGKVFSVELSVGAFIYRGHKVLCVISRDITERIRLEDELRQIALTLESRVKEEIEKNRLKDQLMYEQSRHMAIGELLVNIAHQWRQPLASIGVLVQDLKDAYSFRELNAEYLDKNITNIMSELMGLSNTIDGFKDFYLSNLQKEKVKIKEVINNALEVMSGYFELKDILIDKELDEELTVTVVPSEFAQVVMNILANVRDVFKHKHIANRIVKIKTYKEPVTKKSVITIADNGGGVGEDIIGRIFEPYFTTKDKLRGTGLGLYITRLIVEKSMKGTITVRNYNGGAEFRIEI